MALLRRLPAHLWVTLSAWGSRVVVAGVQVLSVSFLLAYLGEARYAAFVLFTSLINWFNLLDFGLGSAVQNFLSEARARSNSDRPVRVVVAQSGVLLALLATLMLWVFEGSLQRFLTRNLALPESEHGTAMLLTGVLLIVTAIGSIAYRVFYAEQRGYLPNILQGIASLTSLLGVMWLAHQGGTPDLQRAVVVWLLPGALMAAGTFLWVFARHILQTAPMTAWRQVWSRARNFAGFALMSNLVLATDYLIISQHLQAAEVNQYSIITRVFLLVGFFYQALLAALWPVCAELFARNEHQQVHRHILRTLLFGMVLVVGATSGFVLLKDLVVHLLARDQHWQLASSTLWLYGGYMLLRVVSDLYSMLLQSMNRLEVFWYIPVQALLSMIFQWFLVQSLGLNGIVLGLMVAFLLTSTWILPWRFYSIKPSQEVNLHA